MRVTQGMMSNNMMSGLNKSYSQLDKYNSQLTSQKKISKPSQDPVIATKGMYYRTNLSQVQQYQRNIGEAHSWIEAADTALGEGGDVVQRIRELTVQAANDTNSPDSRKAIADEIEQLKKQLETVANTKYGEKYIFNGSNTTNPPIDLNGGTYPGDYNPVNIEVSPGVNVEISMDASKLFTKEMFDDLQGLIDDLRTPGVSSATISAHIKTVDDIHTSFTTERSTVGARQNRMELIEERLDSQEVIATKIMSENEDINAPEVMTQLKTQEMIHRVALSVGTRIIQPSLMDFLR